MLFEISLSGRAPEACARADGRYAKGLGAARSAAAHVPGPMAVTREALRAKTAPAASESPAQGRQFYADETVMPADRLRSGEIASGSLPFTVTGDRFSAPCNNNSGLGPGR